MLYHFQNGGLICGEGTALWFMKAANWNCENNIKVGIVFLVTNCLSFTNKRSVCWRVYGDVRGSVCGEGIALWVTKATYATSHAILITQDQLPSGLVAQLT